MFLRMPNLLLLTGEVHTGKSGRLAQWAMERTADGFVTPTTDGKKQLLALQENRIYPFETREAGEASVSVGRYHLLRSAFDKGTELARAAIQKKSPLFIFDEWGKLEKDRQGFHPAFILLLQAFGGDILVVVRNSLVDDFVEYCREHAARFTIVRMDIR